MKYTIDHDLHIHSFLSKCAKNPEQTPQRILDGARQAGISTICLTNHFWDEAVNGASAWYSEQNYPHICKDLPLPAAEGITFLFGCETDLNASLTLGLSKEKYPLFDFIIVPTTHFHMNTNLSPEEKDTVEKRAKAYINRLDALLAMDLPFRKVGLAHPACPLIHKESREGYLDTLSALPEDALKALFAKAASVGMGIELNSSDINYSPEEEDVVLRLFRIAKKEGCRFYLGSDIHSPTDYSRQIPLWERVIDALGLTEQDKFTL